MVMYVDMHTPSHPHTHTHTHTHTIGYEADGEHDKVVGTEIGESCDERESSSQLIFPPFPACFVPVEVRQRLWSTVPLYHCISLLQETISAQPSENWSVLYSMVLKNLEQAVYTLAQNR